MSDRSRRAAAPAVSIGDRKVVERGSEHRFNHIHEGTFGIQGMDLLSRKVGDDGGKMSVQSHWAEAGAEILKEPNRRPAV